MRLHQSVGIVVGAMASVSGFGMMMARLGCARLLLAKAKGKPEQDLVSRIQKDSLVEVMSQDAALLPGLSSDDRGKLLALLLQCSFRTEDKKAILDLVEPPPSPDSKKRAPMQRFYPQTLQYFRKAEWMAMLERKDLQQAASLVIDRILDLGGCHVREQCWSNLVACLLWVCGAVALDMQAKTRILMFVKAEYKRRARNHKHVEPYLADLPAPADLQRDWPDLWQSIFLGDGPETPPITDSTPLPEVRCRVTKKMQHELALVMSPRCATAQIAFPGDLIQLMQSMQKSHSDLVNLTLRRDADPTPRAALTLQALAKPPAPLPSTRPWVPPLHALHDAAGAAQPHAIEDVSQVETADGWYSGEPSTLVEYSGEPSTFLAGSSSELGPTIEDASNSDVQPTIALIDDLLEDSQAIGEPEEFGLAKLAEESQAGRESESCPENNLECPNCFSSLSSPVPFGEYCRFCPENGDPEVDSKSEHSAAAPTHRAPSTSAPLALQILHAMHADKQKGKADAKAEQAKAKADAKAEQAKAKADVQAEQKKAEADAEAAREALRHAEASAEGLLDFVRPRARPALLSKSKGRGKGKVKAKAKPNAKAEPKAKATAQPTAKAKGKGKGKGSGQANGNGKPKAKLSCRQRIEHRDKRIAAVPADAEPMAPVAKAPKRIAKAVGKRGRNLVEHEASISCWRVRLANGTSKGFSYKRSGSSDEMKLEAERWLASQMEDQELAQHVVVVDESPCE